MKTNWYKTAQDVQELHEIAYKVRKEVLIAEDAEMLKELCLPSSRHLAQVLINRGYNAANVVKGMFRVDYPDVDVSSELDIDDYRSVGMYETEEEEEAAAKEAMESAIYTPLHYWVQINDIVIDITAGQFVKEMEECFPKVVVGNFEDLGRYITMQENVIEPRLMYLSQN
jgi:hypothetical protein